MYTRIAKKINKDKEKIIKFAHTNLSQIVIVIGVFTVFEIIKSFPYINLIPNYQFLTFGITILFAIILFKVIFTNRNIILIIICLFAVAAIASIFEQKAASDFLGFVIFILLVITLRQVIGERKEFKKEMSERGDN